MTKIAVMFANGFEEIEAVTPVDVLRRAGFEVDMVGFEETVTGSHQIPIKMDKVFDGDLSGYQMIICPGGLPGSTHLRDNEALIAELQKADSDGRFVAAICAAPIVLDKAGVLVGRNYTCYEGTEKQIATGKHTREVVVVDGHVITSRGAGTSLAFAYKLVDVLGGDSAALAVGMRYDDLF